VAQSVLTYAALHSPCVSKRAYPDCTLIYYISLCASHMYHHTHKQSGQFTSRTAVAKKAAKSHGSTSTASGSGNGTSSSSSGADGLRYSNNRTAREARSLHDMQKVSACLLTYCCLAVQNVRWYLLMSICSCCTALVALLSFVACSTPLLNSYHIKS
jgi:hypothetical protein